MEFRGLRTDKKYFADMHTVVKLCSVISKVITINWLSNNQEKFGKEPNNVLNIAKVYHMSLTFILSSSLLLSLALCGFMSLFPLLSLLLSPLRSFFLTVWYFIYDNYNILSICVTPFLHPTQLPIMLLM